MIVGCLAWQREGLRPPLAVRTATEIYLRAEDVLQTWLDECCECDLKFDDTVANLWAGWKAWAEKAGEYIGSKRKFGHRLEDKGYVRKSGTHGRSYVGLRFIGDAAKADDAGTDSIAIKGFAQR
jgi:putative DNA primase/helicase